MSRAFISSADRADRTAGGFTISVTAVNSCPKKRCKDDDCKTFEWWYEITPLPLGFVSFTDADGTKYAAFPADDIGVAGTGTGYGETLIRGVPADKYARQSTLGDGHGWFVGAVGARVLYIRHCPASGSCTWHRV